MGVFLAIGNTKASIFAYSSAATAYEPYLTVGDGSQNWTLGRATISVNGGPTNPDGCLLTLAWVRADARQIKVSMHSLLTKKQFWVWYSHEVPPNATLAVTDISSHLQFVALAVRTTAVDVSSVLLFSRGAPYPVALQAVGARGLARGVDVLAVDGTVLVASHGTNAGDAGDWAQLDAVGARAFEL